MNREEKINFHYDMVDIIVNKETLIAEEIARTIIAAYNEEQIDFEQLYKDILDLMYISLRQTYQLTLSEGAKIYKVLNNVSIEKISNEDINQYTYSKDNLSLEQRVEQYIKDASVEKINKDTLIFRETTILDNETLVLHHSLLKSKLKQEKVEYAMVITGGGCNRDCCNSIEPEWMPIDEIEEPPYHPNCTCELIFDENESDDEKI